ncbi:MAG: twin-arginine translocase subunit TatC, partial [Opitutales bacterium]|nr:twin-arginine translocase subunit TatC [Opitutales bacterium]
MFGKRKTDIVKKQAVDDGAEMPFLDHLEELRMTIIKCAIALIIACVIIGAFVVQFNELLMYPYLKAQADYGQDLPLPRVSSMFAPFFAMFNIAIFGGLFIALPFILYFLGQFVLPALSRRERKVLMPGMLAGIALFVLGTCLAFFFILPTGLRVSFELSELMNLGVLFDASSYYSLVVWVPLGTGLAFELPLFIVILIYIGALKVEFLRKYRRVIFVVILVFCAVVTPPDPITLFLLAVPLYALYEIAVFVGDKLHKMKLARGGDDDEEEDEDEPESDIESYRKKAALPDSGSGSNYSYDPTSDDEYFKYVDESYKMYQQEYERSQKEAMYDFSPHFTKPVYDFSPHFEGSEKSEPESLGGETAETNTAEGAESGAKEASAGAEISESGAGTLAEAC